jgi:O-methyltransferase involved in polyketide biosynthesis
MGTNQTTSELQEAIKTLAARAGWKQNELALIIFDGLNEYFTEEEGKAFQERFKKELQRNTTKVERLQEYLLIINKHPDMEKIGLIHNRYISTGKISATLEQAMREISSEIDKKLNQSS